MLLKTIKDWFKDDRNHSTPQEHLDYLFNTSDSPYVHTKTLFPNSAPGMVNSNRQSLVDKVGQALLTHIVFQLNKPYPITAHVEGKTFNLKTDLINVVMGLLDFKLPASERKLLATDEVLISTFKVGIVDLLISLRKPDLAEIAIKRGCKLNYHILERFSVLHLATLYGYKKLIEYILMSTRLTVSSVDVLGNTPLHYASIVHHQGMTRLLIKEAEKLNLAPEHYKALKNKLGGTAQDYAYNKDSSEYFEPYFWVKESNSISKIEYPYYVKKFNAGIMKTSVANPQFLLDLILFIQGHDVRKLGIINDDPPDLDHVYVSKTKNKGWGLFAKRDFKLEDRIGYAGEICNIIDFEGKNLNRKKTNVYSINFDYNYLVDAEENGGIGRFSNCDLEYSNVNCKATYHKGIPFTFLFPRRPIFKDEEIRWHYGASSEHIINTDQYLDKEKLDTIWGKDFGNLIQSLKTTPETIEEVRSFLKGRLSQIKG
jgi:hypothetical protein